MSSRAVCLLAVLGLAACETETRAPTPVENAPAPLETEARTLEVAKPEWPTTLDRDTESRLPAASRAEIPSAPVPVLVPASTAFASNAIVSVGPVWAAVSASADGVTLALHASKLAYKYGDIAPVEGDRVLRGKKGFVTVESNIWQASWVEGGVAYSLHVECANGSDGRCADDKYLVASVESLVYVGGQGARGGKP